MKQKISEKLKFVDLENNTIYETDNPEFVKQEGITNLSGDEIYYSKDRYIYYNNLIRMCVEKKDDGTSLVHYNSAAVNVFDKESLNKKIEHFKSVIEKYESVMENYQRLINKDL